MNDTCKTCGEDSDGETYCDECFDTQAKIRRGEFHDPDLLARDREEIGTRPATLNLI
jgi:hypothetical protein